MPKILGRLPTVPEYYQEFINNSVNLLDEPKQCCPFHHEVTPSFSYNIETGRWSCFGACHAHGDVIEMHRRNYHYDSYEEAKRSLESMYEVDAPDDLRELDDFRSSYVNQEKVDNEVIYQKALALANCPSRWLQLDQAMSIAPVEYWRLQELINEWIGG